MFDYPLRRKTVHSRLKDTEYQMRQERRKPILPGPYVYVGDFDALDPPVATWQSPPWQNNFTWFGTDYVGFRHGLDGYVEFIGVLDLTLGAVTGDVAFKLPQPWRAISFAYTFPIFAGGTDWQNGILHINGDPSNPTTYGDVTVYWPVQADPI